MLAAIAMNSYFAEGNLFTLEQAGKRSGRLLRMQAAELLLLYYRLVVVDVVTVLVTVVPVRLVRSAVSLHRHRKRDRQHNRKHRQDYYQYCHLSVVFVVVFVNLFYPLSEFQKLKLIIDN